MENTTSDLQAIKKELIEIKSLAIENQRMIKGVYKRIRFSSIFSILKWVIIIGVTLGAFYYVQPVFEAVLKTYQSVGGMGSGPNGESFLELWKSL
jgi:hypothetical protein